VSTATASSPTLRWWIGISAILIVVVDQAHEVVGGDHTRVSRIHARHRGSSGLAPGL
jgi:hypothetical protein